jgi:hypothetical protein
MIRDEFGNKPSIMTEFGSPNYTWVDVGRMIHANLVEANTSAYIFWELGWDVASNETMIGLDNAGNYTVRDYFYSVKHFAKYIDKGYTRIAASGSNATYNVTAFRNPGGNQITVVAINNHTSAQPVSFNLNGASITSSQAYRSVEGNFWQDLGVVNLTTTQNLPAKSITTYVINTSPLPLKLLDFNGTYQPDAVALQWKVTSEKDVKTHYVLRSTDPSNVKWDTITVVSALNNYSSIEQYNATDIHLPEENIVYYKLISEDKDGSISASEVIHVVIKENKSDVRIYPNPSSGLFNMLLPDDYSLKSLTVTNSIGRSFSCEVTGEERVYTFGNELPAGFYFVELLSDLEKEVFKIIKE